MVGWAKQSADILDNTLKVSHRQGTHRPDSARSATNLPGLLYPPGHGHGWAKRTGAFQICEKSVSYLADLDAAYLNVSTSGQNLAGHLKMRCSQVGEA